LEVSLTFKENLVGIEGNNEMKWKNHPDLEAAGFARSRDGTMPGMLPI
jgi:hypothetical protein